MERLTPAYWRITFDIPPFNNCGPQTIPQLSEAITQLETGSTGKGRGIRWRSAWILSDAARLRTAAVGHHEPRAGTHWFASLA
jgi:hypothetical protein